MAGAPPPAPQARVWRDPRVRPAGRGFPGMSAASSAGPGRRPPRRPGVSPYGLSTRPPRGFPAAAKALRYPRPGRRPGKGGHPIRVFSGIFVLNGLSGNRYMLLRLLRKRYTEKPPSPAAPGCRPDDLHRIQGHSRAPGIGTVLAVVIQREAGVCAPRVKGESPPALHRRGRAGGSRPRKAVS